MAPILQYTLLAGILLSTAGFIVTLYLLRRKIGKVGVEGSKDLPIESGVVNETPAWLRYHFHYYGIALLFMAFDMEMAFMYPWSVVYKEVGLIALLDMGVFLAILFLGLLYGWSQGGIKRL